MKELLDLYLKTRDKLTAKERDIILNTLKILLIKEGYNDSIFNLLDRHNSCA